MAQGKKLDDKQIEIMRAYLAQRMSVAETARRMGLPKSTVSTWKKRFESEKPRAEDDIDLEQPRPQKGAGARVLEDGLTFKELRKQSLEAVIRDAGDIVSMSQQLIKHNLSYAVEHRERIDRAIDVLVARGEDIAPQELRLCVKVLTELKQPDIGKLSSVMGTAFDKQALACGDPTVNLGGTVAVRRFEDM